MISSKRGIIIKWFDEKGYGFIEPAGGGAHLFFHVRSIRNSVRRDLLGHRVTYLEGIGKDDRPSATDIYLAVEDDSPRNRTPVRRRRRGLRFGAMVAWIIALGYLGAVGFAVSKGYLHVYLLYAYGAMSLVAFIAYSRDKARAGTGEWRTPETTLHWIEVLGGWPGALVAQWQIGHKNRKANYQVMFWMIVALHVVGLGMLTRETKLLETGVNGEIIIEDVVRGTPRDVYHPFSR